MEHVLIDPYTYNVTSSEVSLDRGDVLILQNKHFSYPPFQTFNISCDHPAFPKEEIAYIKREGVDDDESGEKRCGGSHPYRASYRFILPGEYLVKVSREDCYDRILSETIVKVTVK